MKKSSLGRSKGSRFVHKITRKLGRTTSAPSESAPSSKVTVASLLEQLISIEDTPYLVSQRKIPPEDLPRLDSMSVRVGELVRKGEFTRTHVVTACRHLTSLTRSLSIQEDSVHDPPSTTFSVTTVFSGSIRSSLLEKTRRTFRRGSSSDSTVPERRETSLQYTIKTIYNPGDDSSDDEEFTGSLRNQSKIRQEILLEAVYLAVLDHPGIISLRAFPALTSSSFFVLTDRVKETLEDRISQWRRQRRQAKEMEASLRRSSMKRRSTMSKRASTASRKNSAFSAVDTALKEESERKAQQITTQVPEDLVALKTNYALQIANALVYLHSRGIVVRELRPDTVGFMEYPHHHQVQICDLSSAKEMPMDEPWLPSTEPLLLDGEDQSTDDDFMSNRDMIIGRSFAGGMRRSAITPNAVIPESSAFAPSPPGLRRSNTDPIGYRRMNAEPPSFRTTSSRSNSTASISSPPPTPETNSNNQRTPNTDSLSLVSSASGSSSSSSSSEGEEEGGSNSTGKLWMDVSVRSTASSKSHFSTTPTSSQARNCYRAPEMYAVGLKGKYDAKVDCYSLAMIFYELLAEKRPTIRSNAESVEELWEIVRTHRPSMRQFYFPLCIQQLIQHAWEANVSKRYSSEQFSRALMRVLPVMEGKRLDGTRRDGTKAPPRTLPERARRVAKRRAVGGGWNHIRRPDAATEKKPAPAKKKGLRG